MSRAGRKRKSGPRNKNGRLIPQINYRALAGEQPHRRDLPKDTKLRAEGFNELGRLYLRGIITEPEYLAGQEFARVTAMYNATIGTPTALAVSGGSFACDPDYCCSDEATEDDCACIQRRKRYMAVHDAVASAGHRVLVAVKGLVIEDNPPTPEYRMFAIYGLMLLARHLGLTERGKSHKYNN